MRFLRAMAGDMTRIVHRLWPVALVALFAEWGYAVMNVVALPIYLKEARPEGLAAPMSQIGLIISTFLIAETSFKAFFGWAGDRYGRKAFIVAGLFTSAISPILMRLTRHSWVFFPLRALDGIGAAALWPCVFATVASLTTDEERGGAMSVLTMVYMVGIALALPSYSQAVRITGRQKDVFIVISTVFLIAALIALLSVPQTKDPTHASESAAVAGGATAVAEPLGWRQVLELAVGSRVMLAMITASIFQAMATNLLNGVISVYAHEQLDIEATNLGKIMILPGLTIVLLALPLGWLGGRLGKVRSIRIGLVTAALAMALIPTMNSLITLSLIVVPVSIGFLMASPAWMALVTQMAPPGKEGLIVGAVATAQGLGAMLGPALGGWLYEYVRPSAPFYAAAVFFVVALIITVREFHEGMQVVLPT